MIRSGRRRHVVLWVLVTSLVGYGLASALSVRHPGVVPGELVVDRAELASWGTSVRRTTSRNTVSGDVWDADWRRLEDGNWGVVLTRRGIPRPDLLVYWRDIRAVSGDSMLEGAVLLGAMSADRQAAFTLPPGANVERGMLALYSLGHDEIVLHVEYPVEGSR